MIVKGWCQRCPSNQQLFDDVTGTVSLVQQQEEIEGDDKEEQLRRMEFVEYNAWNENSFKSSMSTFSHRLLEQSEPTLNATDCLCPIDAERRGPTMLEVLEQL